MTDFNLDQNNRFVIDNFSGKPPFSSFLPGIAGKFGIPLWVFYVNRGQAIASFGVQDKDSPIIEFQPANKAYRRSQFEGFRTFIKQAENASTVLYEPFAPWSPGDQTSMSIGMNDLALRVTNLHFGLAVSVHYYLLPDLPFAGLVRQVVIRNISESAQNLEIIDGLPAIIPYGLSNFGIKEFSRTLEAWMGVFNLESGIPFYRVLASSDDSAEVSDIQSGHFYLSFDQQGKLLPAIIDPDIIFGQNSSLQSPEKFAFQPLNELMAVSQRTTGFTPCGFSGISINLHPEQDVYINSVIGHAEDHDLIWLHQENVRQPGFLLEKRLEANRLVEEITEVINTQSGMPEFDAYCRQTFLDNILRGGYPTILPARGHSPFVYHLYSRKHGDLERDYNNFVLAPEPFSQGNGNYRDINQNRRNDVFFEPGVADFNVRTFMNLIQPDGYNPLVIHGSSFTISDEKLPDLLEQAPVLVGLEQLLSRSFSLGELFTGLFRLRSQGELDWEGLLVQILGLADQHIEAEFHEGYWIDHWTYNLDLIDDYLSIYPDNEFDFLFGQPGYTYYDSEIVIKPRSEKYCLVGDRIRQYGAIHEGEEKKLLIASRSEAPHVVRGEYGSGAIFLSTLFEKLTLIALLKFTTMDPEGMGIEMEAGRPGWYDALNGLPGLLGSSLSETIELQRLLAFLLGMSNKYEVAISLPVEAMDLLNGTMDLLDAFDASTHPERDFHFWDGTASAREDYRHKVRFGFSGETNSISAQELMVILERMHAKVTRGITRALSIENHPFPTYFSYEVLEYEMVVVDDQEQLDDQGRPLVIPRRFQRHTLPAFLEGPTKLVKTCPDKGQAERIHSWVLGSALFDQKLGMFRICTSLAGESHEIGRARAFTPGWLENESIWTHMSFKYLLSLLEAGLYDDFFAHFLKSLPISMDPQVYGRSILENSSFIVSSAHPDSTLHGAGFVARLTGAAAEFLSIWRILMAGKHPFYVRDDQLNLRLEPVLPGWLFTDSGTLGFNFLGDTHITYHNPGRLDTFNLKTVINKIVMNLSNGNEIKISDEVIPPPYAEMVRNGQVNSMDVYLEEKP